MRLYFLYKIKVSVSVGIKYSLRGLNLWRELLFATHKDTISVMKCY